MSIPNYQVFMRPILEFLADRQEHTIREIISTIFASSQFNFTPSELEQKIPSGRQRVIDGRIAWAKTYLVQAALVEQPRRAICVITARGLEALNADAAINTSYLTQFAEFRDFQTRSNKLPESTQTSSSDDGHSLQETQTPIEQLESTVSTLNAALATDLLATIKNASPAFFEILVVDLMIALGYGGSRKEAGETTQYTQDGGVDGIIKEDKLGLEMIYLQAKRYTDKIVGRPELQAFAGALDMHRAKKGVFITTSSFTRDAKEYVKQIEKRIVLIDGKQLTNLMITNNLGVSVKDVYEVKTLDSDYFTED